MDESNVLLNYMTEQWAQARQSENHRASITRYLMVASIALQGYIVERNFDSDSIILVILLACIGALGWFFSNKYYERFRLHMTRVGRVMDRLEEIVPSLDLNALETKADNIHITEHGFAFMFKRRLHTFWSFFHGAIVVLGIIDAIIIIKRCL